MSSLVSLLRQKQNRNVADKLARYTLLMFTLPLIGFYLSQHMMTNYTSLKDNKIVMYSGFFAVLLANIVIGLYVLMAFGEEEPKLAEGESFIPAIKLARGKERED